MAEIWTGNGRGWGCGEKLSEILYRIPERFDPNDDYQLKKAKDCIRQWYINKILKIKEKQSKYKALGKYTHAVLEEYLKTGRTPHGSRIALTIKNETWTDDDIMAIILPGIKHLPTPGTVETERYFELDLGELGTLVGYIDFYSPYELVGDHKTTSNLKWAHTHETLAGDDQCVIYAVRALHDSEGETVVCRWVYYQTKKPRSRKVEILFHADDLQAPWANILERIRYLKQLKPLWRVLLSRDLQSHTNPKTQELQDNARINERQNRCPTGSTSPTTTNATPARGDRRWTSNQSTGRASGPSGLAGPSS
jgi:hypothetical protein